MSGTLDVKGVDKWAVCLMQLWAERNLFLPDRVQEIRKGMTRLVLTPKLLLKVTFFFDCFKDMFNCSINKLIWHLLKENIIYNMPLSFLS